MGTANGISVTTAQSPIGEMILGATERGCCLVEFADREKIEAIKRRAKKRHGPILSEAETPLLRDLKAELDGYFSGTLRAFTVPLDLKGTVFEQSVWAMLLTIPYGETTSYGEIASMLHRPQAFRAVGRANGANPLSVVVPCHRVTQKGGGLCGYGGGIWRKKYLLQLEAGAQPDRAIQTAAR
jgi:AraC family transcriptional regulator of adaptative response/methylated-DNA-[protein]-cysteine methyltransferase